MKSLTVAESLFDYLKNNKEDTLFALVLELQKRKPSLSYYNSNGKSFLSEAIDTGSEKFVHFLITQGYYDGGGVLDQHTGECASHKLIRRKMFKRYGELLKRNPHINTQVNADKEMPIHLAAMLEHADAKTAMLFLEKTDLTGQTIHARDSLGAGILHILAKDQSKNKLFKHFMESGADISISDQMGYSVFHYAYHFNNYELIDSLITVLAKKQSESGDFVFNKSFYRSFQNMLTAATEFQDLDAISFLIDKSGANSSHIPNIAMAAYDCILVAIGQNNVEFVNELCNINHGETFTKEAKKLFAECLRVNSVDCAEIILKRFGSEIKRNTKIEDGFLQLAILSRNEDLIDILLNKIETKKIIGHTQDQNIKFGKYPVLTAAILSKDLNIFEKSIKILESNGYNAYTEETASKRETDDIRYAHNPVKIALQEKRYDMLGILLDKGFCCLQSSYTEVLKKIMTGENGEEQIVRELAEKNSYNLSCYMEKMEEKELDVEKVGTQAKLKF